MKKVTRREVFKAAGAGLATFAAGLLFGKVAVKANRTPLKCKWEKSMEILYPRGSGRTTAAEHFREMERAGLFGRRPFPGKFHRTPYLSTRLKTK